MKKAILAVSCGTSYPDALENAVGAVEESFRRAFPDRTVRRALTGHRIIALLRDRGIAADTVEAALDNLAREGCEEVILQPTHIIGGREYDRITAAADAYRDRFQKIAVGAPLLHDSADITAVCRILSETYASRSDAVLLMGHGSDHHAAQAYSALAAAASSGCRNLCIVTAAGSPSPEEVFPQLKASGCRSVTLVPLLFTAGAHACRDMAGDAPDSLKSRLEAAGFAVTPILKGLGEHEQIRQIYVSHLRTTDSLL